MAESAVRFFAPDHPQLARTLAGRLKAQQAKLIEELADGYAKDWADYKHRLGYLEGIKDAIRECEETAKDFER